MSENFIFVCPHCGQRIECPDSAAGILTQCPSCGKEIVPDAEIAKDVDTKPEPQNPPLSNLFSFDAECPECKSIIKLANSLKGYIVSCPKCKCDFLASSAIHRMSNIHGNNPPCPLLTKIHRWIGAVHVLIAFVGFIVLLMGVQEDQDYAYKSAISGYTSYSSSQSRTANPKIFWGIAMIITGAGGAIFSFGVAELIQYIGNISHYSRKTFELLAEEKDKKTPKTT